MQKVADAADISVLFFSAGANFWAIFGPFGQFWVFLGQFGQFWVIFGPFFGANFLWQNIALCYLNRFLQLCHSVHFYLLSRDTCASKGRLLQLHRTGGVKVNFSLVSGCLASLWGVAICPKQQKQARIAAAAPTAECYYTSQKYTS